MASMVVQSSLDAPVVVTLLLTMCMPAFASRPSRKHSSREDPSLAAGFRAMSVGIERVEDGCYFAARCGFATSNGIFP